MTESTTTTAPAGLDALLNTREAAAYLRTTEGKLRQDRYRGVGPQYIKIGARALYRAGDLRDYIESNLRVTRQVAL